jgi:hypothetical protein
MPQLKISYFNSDATRERSFTVNTTRERALQAFGHLPLLLITEVPSEPSPALKTFVVYYWSSIRAIEEPLIVEAHTLGELLTSQGNKPWTRIECDGVTIATFATFATKPEKQTTVKSKRYVLMGVILGIFTLSVLDYLELTAKL